MEYKVYSIVNDNGLVNEDILLETEDAEQAKEKARDISKSHKLERHPERYSVEIRFNEDEESGSYETLDFDIWYAVQRNEDDNDWGEGSYDLEEARRMRDKIGDSARIVKVKENYIFGDSEALEVIE